MVGAVARSLVRVSPATDSRPYYHAIAAALLASVRSRSPTPIERFVQGEIWVEYHGLEYLLTKESFFGYYLHAFEPRTARDLLQRHGRVFIDGGANTGQYTIPLARRFETVIAVEPNPIAARILRRNIERNRLDNVEIIERIIAPAAGRQRLYAGGTLTTWGTHYVSDTFIDVDAVTLDELIEPYEQVDLVKLDIEGMEGPAVLASRQLRRVRALSYACNPDQVQGVRDYLKGLGFSVRPLDRLFRSEENWVAEGSGATPVGGGNAGRSGPSMMR